MEIKNLSISFLAKFFLSQSSIAKFKGQDRKIMVCKGNSIKKNLKQKNGYRDEEHMQTCSSNYKIIEEIYPINKRHSKSTQNLHHKIKLTIDMPTDLNPIIDEEDAQFRKSLNSYKFDELNKNQIYTPFQTSGTVNIPNYYKIYFNKIKNNSRYNTELKNQQKQNQNCFITNIDYHNKGLYSNYKSIFNNNRKESEVLPQIGNIMRINTNPSRSSYSSNGYRINTNSYSNKPIICHYMPSNLLPKKTNQYEKNQQLLFLKNRKEGSGPLSPDTNFRINAFFLN